MRRPRRALYAAALLLLARCAALVPCGGGSYVALVTPMAGDSAAVDLGALRELLEWHVASGTSGVVALGTTGEASTLDGDERDDVLRLAVEVCGAAGVPVVAGTGTIDTRTCVQLGRRAADLGADATLVVTPYYVKPPQDALRAHFTNIAERVELPMILYNVPGRTGVDLLPETVAALSTHERIVGIKEATGDNGRVATLRAACGDDFLLYSGEDAMGREFVALGGDGVISVTANVAPAAMSEMLAAPSSAKALRVDDALRPLHEKLFCQANPIPVKWALHRAGRMQAGIRSPLMVLDERFRGDVDDALAAAGIPVGAAPGGRQ
mmetsp:Transcript_16008/g.47619  ORF Transcript_16008/g.47619 Transcript_16008/m.47619 type:complete len:324 (-) Transcript_16008:27-998(-)